MKYIENLDLFGVNFQFTFNKKFFFKTKLSLFLSIIVIFLAFGFAIYNLIEMVNRANLKINIFQSTINTNDTLVLNESNSIIGLDFAFGKALRKDSNRSKFFNITAQQSSYSNFKYVTNSYINTTPCNNLLNRYNFIKNKLSDVQCLNLTNNILRGNNYGFANFSFIFLSVTFDYRQYLSEYNTTTFNDSITLNLYFPMTAYDLNNYEKPATYELGFNEYSLELNKTNSQLITFDIIQI